MATQAMDGGLAALDQGLVEAVARAVSHLTDCDEYEVAEEALQAALEYQRPCETCEGMPVLITLDDGCTFRLNGNDTWAVGDWTSCDHSSPTLYDEATGKVRKWSRDRQVTRIEPCPTCKGSGTRGPAAIDADRLEPVGRAVLLHGVTSFTANPSGRFGAEYEPHAVPVFVLRDAAPKTIAEQYVETLKSIDASPEVVAAAERVAETED